MSWVVVAVAITGCGSGERVVTAPSRPAMPELLGSIQQSSTLSGRVTMSGRPVSKFAIGVKNNKLFFSHMTLVSSEQGTFALKAEPGTWTVVVAGPDFERKEVPNVVLDDHSASVPLHIAVTEGPSVMGTVVDHLGSPVPSAHVRVAGDRTRRSGSEHSDERIRRLYETYETTSDAAGRFTIPNVSVRNQTNLHVRVSGKFASHILELSATNLNNVPVEVLPVSGVWGRITTSDRGQDMEAIGVLLQSAEHPFSAFWQNADADGVYRLDEVPHGRYVLNVIDVDTMTVRFQQPVTLQANQVAEINVQWP